MKLKSFGRVLKKVVAFIVIVQMLFPSAFASGNILSLYKNKEQDNTPFAVGNILPGDYIKQDYCIRVSYNGTVTVKFTADVRQNFEKLAEALKCKVVMPEKNTILYDGLIRDIPDLPYTITGVNTTEDIKYEIAVYLDAVVGNEYQNLRLIADFRWWAETSGGGGGSGSGGGVDPDGPDSPPIDPDGPDSPPIDPDGPDSPPIDPDGPDSPPIDPDGPDSPPIDPDGPDSPPIDPDGPDSSGDYPDKPAVNPDGTPKGELIDPPYTGDYINPVLLIAIICISLFLIFLILFIRKKNKQERDKTIRQLTICIAVIIVLAICLCATTFALIYSAVSVDENIFNTGTVKINLNDSRPIITGKEFLFEPGMTVKKEFFIKNESSDSVYYKIYMDKVSGELKSVIDIKIIDNESGDVLFSGKPENFTQETSESRELFLNETRTLTAIFHYPEESDNSGENMSMEFDMCAVATQIRNNPDRMFN